MKALLGSGIGFYVEFSLPLMLLVTVPMDLVLMPLVVPVQLLLVGHNPVLRQVLQPDHSPVLGLDHEHESQ